MDIGPSCAVGGSLHVPCGGVSVRDARDARTAFPPAGNNVCAQYEGGAAMPTPLGGISDNYFWYHHTAGDVNDVLDPAQLESVAAMLAIWAVTVGNLAELLPRDGPVPPLPPAAGGGGGGGGGGTSATVAAVASVSAVAIAAALGALVWQGRKRGWRLLPAWHVSSRSGGGGAQAPSMGAAYAFIEPR